MRNCGQRGRSRLTTPSFAWLAAVALGAIVFRVEQEPAHLSAARKALDASLRHYERRLRERKSVQWFGDSRVRGAVRHRRAAGRPHPHRRRGRCGSRIDARGHAAKRHTRGGSVKN